MILGNHLIIDLLDCSQGRIDSLEYVYETLIECCKLSGLTVVGSNVKQFTPHGVSVVILLEESHLSFHSYPESHAASIDLYSCNLDTPMEQIYSFLMDKFNAARSVYSCLERHTEMRPHRNIYFPEVSK